MHVDGFRFDLASILTRAENGAPLTNAPIVEAISIDPILSQTKLIAEAWDAGGLYQVGGFYPGDPLVGMEWALSGCRQTLYQRNIGTKDCLCNSSYADHKISMDGGTPLTAA